MTALNSSQLPNLLALDNNEPVSVGVGQVSKSGDNLTYVNAGNSGITARLDKGLVTAITSSTSMTTLAPPLKTLSKAEADELLALDEKYVMRPWAHPPGEPVIVAKASGCVITDVQGKE